ncbi:hypothetical protein PoB_006365700 [Plakobranchus ocellatus]|uniref:Uncharacterized protein n=1 Tax=Plakobranchus ocellatus TaxID=259542 RepID=A0AAV4CZ22_9GAST|nr:hypothetical protein PoB_006365700 [Plakobranchus ocellatus]
MGEITRQQSARVKCQRAMESFGHNGRKRPKVTEMTKGGGRAQSKKWGTLCKSGLRVSKSVGRDRRADPLGCPCRQEVCRNRLSASSGEFRQ